MTQQSELIRDIDELPQKYIGEVLNFVAFLRQKAQQEAAIKEERTAREKAAFEKYAEELNKEMEDVLLDQVDIFEMGDSDL